MMLRALRLLLSATLVILAALPARSAAPAAGAPSGLGPLGDGVMGYVARPEGKGPFPGVVVIHEWWGVNDQIKSIADRLAKEGYVAAVPDLYKGKVATEPEKAHELMRGLDQDEAVVTLKKTVDWLAAQPEVKGKPVGSVGFCMGGGLSLKLGLADPRDKAVAVFYGQPETAPDKLKALKGEVLGCFGAADEGIPPAKAELFEKGLKAAGIKSEIVVYPGAGHAFMNDTRPSYDEKAAKDAWAKLLALFARNLKGK